MIAIAAAAMLVLGGGSGRYSRLERSAEAFHNYFQALKSSEVSVSPVERVVFSLILANTNADDAERACKTRT